MVQGTRKSDIGNEPEDNSEKVNREEFNRLARQLRQMENDKGAYLKESNGALNHQKHILKSLQNQKSRLFKELENQKKILEIEQLKNLHNIRLLIENYKKLVAKVKSDKKNLTKIQESVKEISDRVEELKFYAGRKEAEQASFPETGNRIYLMKKKLETVTRKFDTTVAQNAEARKIIDEAFRNNLAVTQKCIHVEEGVLKGRERIEALVDQTSSAYDQREEALNKVSSLLEKNAKDKKQHILEMSEIIRNTRHEQKLLNFVNVKNKDRFFLETKEERLSRLEHVKEKVNDETLESYEKNLSKLLTEQSPTFSSLIQEYFDLYDQNIRRYSYINELNKELEESQMEVSNLREEIRIKSAEIIEKNNKRNEYLLKRKKVLEQLDNEYEKVLISSKQVEFPIKTIVLDIQTLFQSIRIDERAYLLHLVDCKNISSDNVILYINILEKWLSEMMDTKEKDNIDDRSLMAISENELEGIYAVKTSASSSPIGAGSVYSARQSITMDTSFKEESTREIVPSPLLNDETIPLAYNEIREKLEDEDMSRPHSCV